MQTLLATIPWGGKANPSASRRALRLGNILTFLFEADTNNLFEVVLWNHESMSTMYLMTFQCSNQAFRPAAEHHMAANGAAMSEWPGKAAWMEPAVWDVRCQAGLGYQKPSIKVKGTETHSSKVWTALIPLPLKGGHGLQTHQRPVSPRPDCCGAVHERETSIHQSFIAGACSRWHCSTARSERKPRVSQLIGSSRLFKVAKFF